MVKNINSSHAALFVRRAKTIEHNGRRKATKISQITYKAVALSQDPTNLKSNQTSVQNTLGLLRERLEHMMSQVPSEIRDELVYIHHTIGSKIREARLTFITSFDNFLPEPVEECQRTALSTPKKYNLRLLSRLASVKMYQMDQQNILQEILQTIFGKNPYQLFCLLTYFEKTLNRKHFDKLDSLNFDKIAKLLLRQTEKLLYSMKCQDERGYSGEWQVLEALEYTEDLQDEQLLMWILENIASFQGRLSH